MMPASKNISKRDFLKLMGGLSLGLLPFVSCFNRESPGNGHEDQGGAKEKEKNPDREKIYPVTDKDVILLTRNDELFARYNKAFNKRITQAPKYIAVCFTDMGVQFAIQKAKQEQLPVAIKSGGHSFEGFSGNNDGMVINVSQMKSVIWNNDGTVSVGPGLLLRELHDQVYAKGKLVPAGSCGGVGIAGLALGGGYGFFSRAYGLSCDAMTDAKIVKADEAVIQAASDEQLIWALRGAGNGNFGVITELKFRTQPLPASFNTVTIKIMVNDSATFGDLLGRFMNLEKQLAPESFAAFVQNGKTLTLLFTDFGGKDLMAVADLFAAGAKSVTSSSSAGKPFTPALKRFYGRAEPLYFKNASCGYYRSFEDIAQVAGAVFEKVTGTPGIIFQVNTLGGKINEESFESISCYPHRGFPILSELQGYYNDKSQEPAILKTFREIQNIVRNSGITAQYYNYPDLDFPNWQQAYFGDSYSRLQEIKSVYDPGNLFRHAQSVDPQNL